MTTSYRIESVPGVTFDLLKGNQQVKNGFVDALNNWTAQGWRTIQIEEVGGDMLLLLEKQS